MFYFKTVRTIMSIQIISTNDNITINETLNDSETIYEYINKVINILGIDTNIYMNIIIFDKLITIKLK